MREDNETQLESIRIDGSITQVENRKMRITVQNKTGCGDNKPLRNGDLMLTGPDTDH